MLQVGFFIDTMTFNLEVNVGPGCVALDSCEAATSVSCEVQHRVYHCAS